MTGAVVEGRRRVIRSHMSRLRAAHSYRIVLVLILVAFAFASLAGDATWTVSTLLTIQAATLAAAVWTSGIIRTDSNGLLLVLVAAMALAFAVLVDGSDALVGAAGIVSGVLLIGTVVAIATGVVDQDEVNAQSVTGAICIYLLFGLVFLFFYGAIAVLDSGTFFAQGTDGTRALRVYFSYVTLATLGYGDYTPAGELGHLLAVLEALIGQLYLVTVIALLVSRLRRGDD
jgi:hypothetical protein